MMVSDKNVCEYIILQFIGYMLQMFPMIFLFYVPFRQECLRFSKTKIYTGLGIAVFAASWAMALYLGSLLEQGMDAAKITWTANVLFFLCLIATMVFYFFSFRAGIHGRLFFFTMNIEYGIMLYILNEIGSKYFILDVPVYFPYNLESVLLYAGSILFTFPLLVYFFHRLNRRFHLQETVAIDLGKLRLVTACSVFIVCLTGIALQMEIGLMHIFPEQMGRFYLSVLLLCILFSNVLAYSIYFGFIILGSEKERMRNRLTMYEMQYAHVHEQIEKGKRLRHNLRHHFRTLAMLLSEEKPEELRDYIDGYIETLDSVEVRAISSNPIVNSVLSYYVQQAEEKQISVTYDIQMKESYPFDIRDMTVLLGNAMENAIREAYKCPTGKAAIRMMIKQQRKQLLIQMENTIAQENNEKTELRKKRRKGYGLESIEMIAKKYDGSFEISTEEDKFLLRVILNITDSKEM